MGSKTKLTNPAIGDANKLIIVGRIASRIEVKISYRIIDCFLRASTPNKAIEELVVNSFDAGATKIHVILPLDFREQGASIAATGSGWTEPACGSIG